MKKLLAIVLSVVLVLSLTACGKSYTGKYALTAVKSEGMEIKKGDSTWDIAFSEKDKQPYLELKDDDKFTLLFDESQDGTYKVDGDKITLKADGESIEGKIKDDKITIEIEGSEAVFELEKDK